jgi:hypothetical protein
VARLRVAITDRCGRRTTSQDTFTAAVLRLYVEMIEEERRALGRSYPRHGKLVV